LTATRYLVTIAFALLFGSSALGQTPGGVPTEPSVASIARWSFSFSLSGYLVPNDRSYASPTFSAEKRHFHLEARYDYEDQNTGSMWLGHNFEVGDKLVLQATPMIGGVVGHTSGIAPGYEASLSWKALEFSTEGEFVFDTKDSSGNFFYSWMELSYSSWKWCRVGLVAQRTKAYHTNLDIQRGLLVGVSHKNVDFTTYMFNAGWSDPTIVTSIGVKF
jgi:hypothetical protein